jgi:hypothetical protein
LSTEKVAAAAGDDAITLQAARRGAKLVKRGVFLIN